MLKKISLMILSIAFLSTVAHAMQPDQQPGPDEARERQLLSSLLGQHTKRALVLANEGARGTATREVAGYPVDSLGRAIELAGNGYVLSNEQKDRLKDIIELLISRHPNPNSQVRGKFYWEVGDSITLAALHGCRPEILRMLLRKFVGDPLQAIQALKEKVDFYVAYRAAPHGERFIETTLGRLDVLEAEIASFEDEQRRQCVFLFLNRALCPPQNEDEENKMDSDERALMLKIDRKQPAEW